MFCVAIYLAGYYQTNVPTAPPSKVGVTLRPLKLILKVCELLPSFSTINTFFPSGRLNATLYKLPVLLLATLVEPDGTNLDACAIM